MRPPLAYRDLGILVCGRQHAALLTLRQEDLAAMIEVSRQTIHKELKRLGRAATIELSYGAIDQ